MSLASASSSLCRRKASSVASSVAPFVRSRFTVNTSTKVARSTPRRFASSNSAQLPPPSRRGLTSAQNLALSVTLVFGSSALGFILASTLHAHNPAAAPVLSSPDGTGPGTNHPIYGSAKDYLSAIEELRSVFRVRDQPIGGVPVAADGTQGNEVGAVEVSTDEGDLESHGGSEWSYHGEFRPSVVVFVQRCVRRVYRL